MSTPWKLDTTVGAQYVGCGVDSAYLSDQFWGVVSLDFDDYVDDRTSICCVDDYADFNDRLDTFDNICNFAKNRLDELRKASLMNERALLGMDLPPLVTSSPTLPNSRYQPNADPTTVDSVPDLIVTSPYESADTCSTPARPRAPLHSNLLRHTPPPPPPHSDTPLTAASTFLDTLVRLTQSPIEPLDALIYPVDEEGHSIIDSEIFVSVIDHHRQARMLAPPRLRWGGFTDAWSQRPDTVFDLSEPVDSAVDCTDGMEFMDELMWEQHAMVGTPQL